VGIHDLPWEEIAEYLAKSAARRPEIREVLGAHQEILRLQYLMPATPDLPRALAADLRGHNATGKPVLPRSEFALDLPAATRLFHGIGEALKGRGFDVLRSVEAIEGALHSGHLDLASLLRGALADPKAPSGQAAAAEAEPELLARWCAEAVRPSAEACRRAVEQWVESAGWSRRVCPVCGSLPRIAELRGAELAAPRFLHCGFCGFAWRSRRQECGFCGTADHRELLLLIPEEDRRCHVEVCNACRRYLKVVDNKEFFGLIPFLEDLATPHLDVLARDRGYW